MLELTMPNVPFGPVRCQALLFDMDGTLVDSRECVERTWRAWCARHRLDFDSLWRISHGRRNRETIRLVAPYLDIEEEISLLVRAEEDCREGITAIRGAARLLGGLAPIRWGVVTSAWRRLAEIRLNLAGLPLPSVLVTADDVRQGKPDPEGYLTAAARLGVDPAACVAVEDAPAGVAAARAAGMRVIGVLTTFSSERLEADWHVPDFDRLVVRDLAPGAPRRPHALGEAHSNPAIGWGM
ncbi:hypothetical protein GCM10010116_29120 [Microbispora rosea subsp. aerata]|nr:HAD-IA family hydrolase [Microbispora rosea]GGO14449.1 hypothetical protein GCM10010116_29120 [Microbispora rosea subsp. aerata]GIH55526.1 hypothetical protein Mro02_24400 [Microbispora rosea subsp. aerata]GLJ86470.1 hypothetical protein GCM10017588_52080 [Microbispora rosea subsp. aerata]